MRDLVLKLVSFSYEGFEKPLISDLSVTFSPGWTGVVGANGCGKSTLLRILSGELPPTSGSVTGTGVSVSAFCPQDTLSPPENLVSFRDSFEKEAIHFKTKLGLHDLIERDWSELSDGERKRFQLGCALVNNPDLLQIDEPTNHLDGSNRSYILDALHGFSGIGIVVSHDRALLNRLCRRCLIHNGSGFVLLSGNYDESMASLENLENARLNRAASLANKSKQLLKEVNRITEIDQKTSKRLSKKGLSKTDHDAKSKVDLARLTGKDASLGKKKGQLQTKIADLEDEKRSLRGNKDYSDAIFFTKHERKNRVLLDLKAGNLPLPDGSTLMIPDLVLRSNDKIGVIGQNGTGKSSLLRYLLDRGIYRTEKLLYLNQELDQQDIQSINADLANLSKDKYAQCLQIFARLGSDAKQVLKSSHRSPGEIRKLAIALAIVEGRELLVLDEPTNHLDLPSIEQLEKALSLCSIALILVSHDMDFMAKICEHFWRLERQPAGASLLTID